jgi:hypothetical protein
MTGGTEAMQYKDLREFVEHLERGGLLKRIATAVDPSRGVRLVDGDQEAELPRFDQDEIVRAL